MEGTFFWGMEVSVCRLYRVLSNVVRSGARPEWLLKRVGSITVNPDQKSSPKMCHFLQTLAHSSHHILNARHGRSAKRDWMEILSTFLSINGNFLTGNWFEKIKCSILNYSSYCVPNRQTEKCKWSDTTSALCNTKHLAVANFAQLLFRRKWYKHKSKMFLDDARNRI